MLQVRGGFKYGRVQVQVKPKGNYLIIDKSKERGYAKSKTKTFEDQGPQKKDPLESGCRAADGMQPVQVSQVVASHLSCVRLLQWKAGSGF